MMFKQPVSMVIWDIRALSRILQHNAGLCSPTPQRCSLFDGNEIFSATMDSRNNFLYGIFHLSHPSAIARITYYHNLYIKVRRVSSLLLNQLPFAELMYINIILLARGRRKVFTKPLGEDIFISDRSCATKNTSSCHTLHYTYC